MKRSQRMLVRQWQLVVALAGSKYGLTIGQLEQATGRKRATVYRYLSVLDAAGVPIHGENRNGEARYRLARSTELPPLGPNALQIAALHLARAELEPLAGTSLVAELDALLAKLRPPAGQLGFHFTEKPPRPPEPMRTIERALNSKKRARIEYRAASRAGAASVVHVEPLLINVAEGTPYLRAYCVERRAERTYKLARIISAELTDQAATYHPAEPPRRAFAHAVKAWTGGPTLVRIRLEPAVAWLAAEHPLVPAQRLLPQADGSALVEAEVAGLVEAARWTLSWGDAAEALEPPELRQAVRGEIARALTKYDGPGPAKAGKRKSTSAARIVSRGAETRRT